MFFVGWALPTLRHANTIQQNANTVRLEPVEGLLVFRRMPTPFTLSLSKGYIETGGRHALPAKRKSTPQ